MNKAKDVMDNFMQKLYENKFKKDTLSQENGVEINDAFIEEQIKEYQELLNSEIMNKLKDEWI